MKPPPRNRFLILFLFASLASLFVFRVNAHPGRTDDDGGHTDNETGEYHYHHGYSAHAHYDMDGDGIVDCPYDFDDQTSHQTGASGGSGYSFFGNGDPYTSGYSDGYEKGHDDAQRTSEKKLLAAIENTRTNIFGLTFLPTTIFFLVIIFVMHKKHSSTLTATKQDLSKKVSDYQKQIQNLKKTHSLEIEILKDQHSEELSKLKTQLKREQAHSFSLQDDVRMWTSRYRSEKKKNDLLQSTYTPSSPHANPEQTTQLNSCLDTLPADSSHKAHFLMESSDGMLVRVPEDKLDAWQAVQEGRGPVPSPEMKKLFREEITKRIYGTPSGKE